MPTPLRRSASRCRRESRAWYLTQKEKPRRWRAEHDCCTDAHPKGDDIRYRRHDCGPIQKGTIKDTLFVNMLKTYYRICKGKGPKFLRNTVLTLADHSCTISAGFHFSTWNLASEQTRNPGMPVQALLRVP